MIAGVPKCGTTALKHYLAEHPDVSTHDQTEFGYFQKDHDFGRGWTAALREYFPNAPYDDLLLAKNSGLLHVPVSMRRLAVHSPELRIMVILRHPTRRTFSSFVHEVRHGAEAERNFDEFLPRLLDGAVPAKKYKSHIENSRYERALTGLVRHFPRASIQVLIFEEMVRGDSEYWSELHQFLGLPPGPIPDLNKKHNETKAQLSRNYGFLVNKLLDEGRFYKEPIKRLFGRRRMNRLGANLRNLNWTEGKDVELSESAAKRLDDYWEDEISKLENFLGRTIRAWR